MLINTKYVVSNIYICKDKIKLSIWNNKERKGRRKEEGGPNLFYMQRVLNGTLNA